MIKKIKNLIFKTKVEAIIKRKEDSIIKDVTTIITSIKIKDSRLLYS